MSDPFLLDGNNISNKNKNVCKKRFKNRNYDNKYMNPIKESFLDNNINILINLHEDIVETFSFHGILNNSKSSRFIEVLINSIVFNHTNNETSEDDT